MIKLVMTHKIYLILDNVRSAHNVGAMLRTAEGLGVSEVYLCGITPYPKLKTNDQRPPYLADKITRRITKTSLGAEASIPWSYHIDAQDALNLLKQKKVELIALEQSPSAVPLNQYLPKGDLALIVGNEVDGVSSELLTHCDQIVELPMSGMKESFNVSAAAAMALFYLTLMV